MLAKPLYRRLRKRLLSAGGKEVVLLEEDPHVEDILRDGILWPDPRKQVRGGEQHRCHQNAARLWLKDKRGKLSICTGYGLACEIWMQHTWIIDKKHIRETVCIYDKYFGIELNDKEALKLAFANLPHEEVFELVDGNKRVLEVAYRLREEHLAGAV